MVAGRAERSECIEDNVLAAFFEGRLDDARATDVELHLDVCLACRGVLAVLGGGERPAMPRQIGRYELRGVLGQGAMGVVYLARDPELGRQVAVKVVQAGASADADAARERNARLLREAQAMARLSHPNVAAVHDAGTSDGTVFVAIEYVDGTTLAGWLRERPRAWREALDLLIAAGRGLAAAHAAGIVHRDFKPANVLIGRDGRVRVADFGLARELADASTLPEANAATGVTTRTGALVGSPAYMAPEQLAGGRADERSDQFAFAVTLYEALLGRRPFEAPTVELLAAAIAAGPPSTDGRVPARLGRILARALRAEPAERYPAIEALVDDLARARHRPRTIAWVSTSTALAAIATVTTVFAMRGPEASACAVPVARVQAAWSDGRALQIRAAFSATGLPFAPDAARQVQAALDRYADAWSTAYVEACAATRERHEVSADVLDRRMACLDDRLRAASALGVAFTRADATAVRKAAQAVAALPSIDACGDLGAVMARVAPPAPALRERIDAARDAIAALRALRLTGRYADATARADELLATARTAGYAPVIAEALFEVGELAIKRDDAKAAIAQLDEAARTAYAAGDDELAARAWISIIYAASYTQADATVAEKAADMARAALARTPRQDVLAVQLLANEGVLDHARGRYADARAHYIAGLELAQRSLAEHHELQASLRNNLANTEAALGEVAHAGALVREAIAIRERALGPSHPETAANHANLGAILARQGAFADALAEIDGAIATVERALGPAHPDVATYLVNSCHAVENLGRAPEALARAHRARAIFERAVGADDPRTIATTTLVAKLLVTTGKADEAVPLFDEALARQAKRLGAAHPALATTLNNLGAAHAARGDHAAALTAFTRSLAIAEAALGATHRRLAYSLVGIGAAQVELRAWEPAIAALRRTLALLEAARAKGDDDRGGFGEARLALADALWRSGRDRAEARTLADQAIADYEAAGDATALARARRWPAR